jgi:predicted PilT family ATPase
MKKVLVFITITILLIVLISCHAYIEISGQQDYEVYQDKNQVGVLDLTTNQNKTIYFDESVPGKMSNGEVIGFPQVRMRSKADSIIYKNKKHVAQYVWKNGKKHEIIHQDEFGLTCTETDTTRIPFSEVKEMHVKKFETGKTVLLAAGLTGGVAGIIALVTYMAFSNWNMDLDGW